MLHYRGVPILTDKPATGDAPRVTDVQQKEVVDEFFPVSMPDPIEVIKTRMEDLGLQTKDVVDVIGDKGTVSKVLNRKIPLSLRMIRKLSAKLHIPAEILIQEPKLATG